MRTVAIGAAALVLSAMPALALAVQPPSPSQLWRDIQALQKGHALMLRSKAYQPGSRTVDVYTVDLANAAANDTIRKAGSIGAVQRYPNGALLVKENFDADRKLTGITATLKLDGYDKADRNWVWAAYAPTGKVVSYGKVQACIACHAMVNTQDVIFAPPPDQLLPVSVWTAFFPKQKMSPTYLRLLRAHPAAIVK
ncbi:MAG: cytochrome P460 family protein [Betaproteobacteria bacterium]|nr:cytochrome P460 family protein [Betaproteobacteria bacterium]